MMRHTLLLAAAVALPFPLLAQGTRLLRQPTVSATHLAFEYGGDLWIVEKAGGEARRLTSTPAVEAEPQLSPDGRSVAFTSNRSGNRDVYVMPVEGIPPDIEVPLDAKSVAAGRDPQLERGVAEALNLLQQSPVKPLTLPPASKRARRPVP